MKNQYPTSLITVINNSKDIIEPTNYWNSEMAQKGYCLVSTNAGCVRLLVPDSMAWEIPDIIKGVQHVVISLLRNHETAPDGVPMVSLLFEDKSNTPYCLTLGRGSIMLLPSPKAKGEIPLTFALWGRKNGKLHKFMERPAFIRYVNSVQCVRAWNPTIDGARTPDPTVG